jgi:hypothetical protein
VNEQPPGGTERAGAEPASGLDRALTEVRARAPEYRRWWIREHGSGPHTHGSRPNAHGSADPGRDESTQPWSDDDEEQAGQLRAVDPWWFRTVAHELERAHADLRDVGAELTRMAASAIGTSAAARCAELAATSHERAVEVAVLASGVRTAGDRAGELLDGVARRLAAVDPDSDSDWHSGAAAGRSGADDHVRYRANAGDRSGADGWAGGGFSGYAAVLRALRAELNSAIELLPTLVGIHPADRTEPGGWSAQPGMWVPEPGNGPRLAGTDGHRVETDTGVRIARLPDGPRR